RAGGLLMLDRLVRWSYDRRRRVVALWIGAVVLASVLAGAAGRDDEVGVRVAGSDSAAALDLLADRFPRFAGATVDVVYASEQGVTGPDVTTRIEDLSRDLAGVDHVISAEPGPVAPDGRTGILRVAFDEPGEWVPVAAVEQVIDLAGEAAGDDLQVELGGYPIERVESAEAGSEGVGLLAAMVILLVAFGSALAAGLPL